MLPQLDLQDAYLHVPILPSSRHLLCFAYKDQVYQYQVLPFGLKDSPWVFTRLVAVVIASLRQSGIRIFHYLDDWLLVANSMSLLELHLQKTLELTGLPSEFGEVFSDSLSNSVLSGSFFRLSEAFGMPFTLRVVALQSTGAGNHSSLVFTSQDLTGVPWSPSQFHGFDSSVQVIRAPSSTSLPEVLFAQGHSFPTCFPFPSSQESLSYVGFSGVPSAGQVFSQTRPSKVGELFFILTMCQAFGLLWSLAFTSLARTSNSLSGPSELRRSDLRSIDPDLHGGLLHQPSERDSLPSHLQFHVRPVGLVSGERFSPLSLSCPRGRQPAGGLPLQGEVPAFRVDPESLGFSGDFV